MLHGKYIQYNRGWKYIDYVSTRAASEMKWNIRMLDTDHPRDASQAAFKRVCEHIRYNHPKRAIPNHDHVRDNQPSAISRDK